MNVSESALCKRLNRKLAVDGLLLKRTRSINAEINLGRYYIVDLMQGSFVIRTFVDLADLTSEMGVLSPCEHILPSDS